MKKTIAILIGSTVAISLIWLIDETLLTETSAPKTAEKRQESAVERQDSPTRQKTKAKPTTKPPIYDLSQKAHWYDPETTIGFRGSSKTLSEWLEPFHPTPQEFQFIAQFEISYKNLKESLSEDEYYSVEGRKQLIDESLKLNKQLREQLGEERTQFYAEVRKLETGYYDTWKVLTVNGISEEGVSEFRELADEFNQQMQDFRTDFRDKRRIAKSFRDRIEKEFGKQVLDDIYFLNAHAFSMNQLDLGDPRAAFIRAQYPEQKERLKDLYDFEFGVGTGAFEKFSKESDRREKLEMKLWREWVKHYDEQPLDPEEFLLY